MTNLSDYEAFGDDDIKELIRILIEEIICDIKTMNIQTKQILKIQNII